MENLLFLGVPILKHFTVVSFPGSQNPVKMVSTLKGKNLLIAYRAENYFFKSKSQ